MKHDYEKRGYAKDVTLLTPSISGTPKLNDIYHPNKLFNLKLLNIPSNHTKVLNHPNQL